ncbi:MAG: phosphoglucomutase/phosphomannomutase family protein [Elusimicrobiota bacterium]
MTTTKQSSLIKFGTSGWRGIISDNFTFHNLRLVTQAIAEHLNTSTKNAQLIIGYDTRFLSEKFAREAACVLAANRIKSFYTDSPTPTPTIACEIIRRKTTGGLNITASHNPPEYNGLKYSSSWGGPALPEETKIIEKNCHLLQKKSHPYQTMDWGKAIEQKIIKIIDPKDIYLNQLKKLIDTAVLKKAKLKIGVDLLYGSGIGYLDSFLREANCRVYPLHCYRDTTFGGFPPEPAAANLTQLFQLVKKEKAHLGLSVDADADRFGIIDSEGNFISPNRILGLFLDHLVQTRNWRGVVARSVMTSQFIDAVAHSYHLEVRETPVGFKYIGEVMQEEEFIIGGEESGGLTIKGHVPEKDGVLACLLAAELAARQKKSLTQLLKDLYRRVGLFLDARCNFRLPEEKMAKLAAHLNQGKFTEIEGMPVSKHITIDGHKFVFPDGSWLGIRFSGTEPVVRLYLEANSSKKLAHLAQLGKKFIGA